MAERRRAIVFLAFALGALTGAPAPAQRPAGAPAEELPPPPAAGVPGPTLPPRAWPPPATALGPAPSFYPGLGPDAPRPYGAPYGTPPGPPGGLRAAGRPPFWRRCWCHMQDCFAGYPDKFEEPPLGHWVYAHYNNHVANGIASRMVLHHFDFVDGTAALTVRGYDELARIATTLGTNGFPIVIERTPWDPALAEARRRTVVAALSGGPFAVPPDRVVVGQPLTTDIEGVQNELVNQNLLLDTLTGGTRTVVGGRPFGGVIGLGTPVGGSQGGGGSGGGTGTSGSP